MNNNGIKISLSDKVFESLEGGILDGAYKPGEYLSENRISEELGVSRTPVREALRRLEQDGLIEQTPRGALVIGITEDDINIIYEIRARIEGYATRLFTERVTDEKLAALEENLGLQEFYLERGRADSSGDLDSSFHDIIYESCGSRILDDILSSLHNKVRRCRRAFYADLDRAKAAVAEHRAIFEAVRLRDSDAAERIASSHVKSARESIIGSFIKNREDNA